MNAQKQASSIVTMVIRVAAECMSLRRADHWPGQLGHTADDRARAAADSLSEAPVSSGATSAADSQQLTQAQRHCQRPGVSG